MEYQVEVRTVTSQTTAVVHCLASLAELSTVLPRACGEVWAFIRSAGLPRPGRNLALYLDDVFHIECGVEMAKSFTGNERIVCSSTPAGIAATAIHLGPYSRLVEAHTAIRAWCSANGKVLAGPAWELYDHWNDDPAQLRTDVYYLLKG